MNNKKYKNNKNHKKYRNNKNHKNNKNHTNHEISAEEYIENQIDNSKLVIRELRYKKLYNLLSKLECKISEASISILESYDTEDYYLLTIYPDNYKNDIFAIRSILEDTIKLLNIDENKISITVFIYNFITEIYYETYKIMKIINIYYPKFNNKFSMSFYRGNSRYNVKNIKKMSININKLDVEKNKLIRYIHPKYILEKYLADIYNPAKYDNYSDNVKIANKLLNEWKIINPDDFNKNYNIHMNLSKKGLSIMSLIEEYVYESYYDRVVPTCIATTEDEEIINKLIQHKYKNIEISEGSAKTIVDPRLINKMYKINNELVLKIWFIGQFELIPILPFNNQVHISVIKRLILSEYLTYDIIKNYKVAFSKLILFRNILKVEKKLKQKKIYISLDKCNFIGAFYPKIEYYKKLRIEQISNYIKLQNEQNK